MDSTRVELEEAYKTIEQQSQQLQTARGMCFELGQTAHTDRDTGTDTDRRHRRRQKTQTHTQTHTEKPHTQTPTHTDTHSHTEKIQTNPPPFVCLQKICRSSGRRSSRRRSSCGRSCRTLAQTAAATTQPADIIGREEWGRA